jgi:hypothetical protein
VPWLPENGCPTKVHHPNNRKRPHDAAFFVCARFAIDEMWRKSQNGKMHCLARNKKPWRACIVWNSDVAALGAASKDIGYLMELAK